MLSISFSDPGMRPRTTQAATLEAAIETVRKEVSHYTEAFIVDGSKALAMCRREVGETEWSIKALKPRT
jgi:hypothetical protein